MREFKGTKGEWFADGYDIFAENGDYHICKISADLDDSVEEANAELIAAAPELLEALNVAVGYLSQEVDHQSSLFMSVIDLCNEAIDKALGVK